MNNFTPAQIRQMRENLENQRREAYEHARAEKKEKTRGPLGRIAVALLEPVSSERRKDRQLRQLERSLVDIAAFTPEQSSEYHTGQASYSTLAEGSATNTAVRIGSSGEVGVTSLTRHREVDSVADVTGGVREMTFDNLAEHGSLRDMKRLAKSVGSAAVRLRIGEATPVRNSELAAPVEISTANDTARNEYDLAA
jgi:hypothetical protein